MSMIESIVLTGTTHTITLPVISAKPTDQYILRNATGLGPPEVDLGFVPISAGGNMFTGGHARDREIVLLIRLNPVYGASPVPVSELRSILYTLMQTGMPLTITVNTNSPAAPDDYVPVSMKTEGYIRRIESVPFDKDTSVQITIACPSPVFEAMSLTNIATALPIPIVYNATAETGFYYVFKMDQAVSGSLAVRVQRPNYPFERITIPSISAAVNDILTFDTRLGQRMVEHEKWATGQVVDLTGVVTLNDDVWPTLHPGNNTVSVTLNSSVLNPQPTNLTFQYTKQYWGV